MPVSALYEMSYEEFSKWLNYFERRPQGWREDLRTSYIMQSFGAGKSVQNIFPSLVAITKEGKSKKNILSNSQMLQQLFSAKNGSKLKILEEL